LKVDGVVDTVVGYTGHPDNNKDNKPPTYDSVCFGGSNWVEGVRVLYDDDILSYEQLLDEFFHLQEPVPGYRQYDSIVFVHDENQRELAQRWLDESKSNDRVVRRDDGIPVSATSIEPLSAFYRAEEYHQRYWQKFRPRIATMVTLMGVGSGLVDDFFVRASAALPLSVVIGNDNAATTTATATTMITYLHNGANALVLAGCLYVLAERLFDTRTVKI